MVAPAELAPDFGIAARGEHLRKVHCHLARAHDGAGAALGAHLGAVDAVELAYRPLDLVNGDAAAVGREDVGKLFLRKLQRDSLSGELGIDRKSTRLNSSH